VLRVRLPDFFLRTALWWRWQGRRKHLEVCGQEKLTGEPVLLATNCRNLGESLHVSSATVRPVKYVLPEGAQANGSPALLRFLARRAGTIFYPPDEVERAGAAAARALRGGNLVSLSSASDPGHFERLLEEVQRAQPVRVVPVYCEVGVDA